MVEDPGTKTSAADQALDDRPHLGAGARLQGGIRRRATHLQAQRSKRLVHLAQTARADAEVAHAEPHEQWRDERIGCRLATHRHRPGVLACRAADEPHQP